MKILTVCFVFLLLNTNSLVAKNFDFEKLGTDLVIHSFSAKKPIANVIWLPSEYGVLPEENHVASELASKGVSVVMPDFFASYFLPVAPSSLSKISQQDVVELIELVQDTNPKLPLFIVSANLGAAYALKALLKKQSAPISNVGLVLVNPNLYVETPDVGEQAKYWSEVSQLNLPVYILQSELSPWKWQLSSLAEHLEESGSNVFIEVKPQLRDRYYFRADASAIEQVEALKLADNIVNALQRLAPYLQQKKVRGFAKLKPTLPQTELKPTKRLDIADYEGRQNLPLSLLDMKDNQHNLKSYQGKVVLLNFWASWCPPCVHEIPSMVRLKNIMKGKPFEILAVNLGEEQAEIVSFLNRNKVNFPVLRDPKGRAVKDWRVFAYPSTYLIDKKGRIRSAKFGGYDWDSPLAKEKINSWLVE